MGGADRREGKNYAMSPNFLYILHNFTPARTYLPWFSPK
jgi:hypothetical protein